MYTRLQTVWSLPGHSRQANKDHIPRCHRRPNGPGQLADKVVQPTTQSAEGCTWIMHSFQLYKTCNYAQWPRDCALWLRGKIYERPDPTRSRSPTLPGGVERFKVLTVKFRCTCGSVRICTIAHAHATSSFVFIIPNMWETATSSVFRCVI